MGKPLSIFQQARLLRTRFPTDKVWTKRSGNSRLLFAELRLRPEVWCGTYIVRFGYVYGLPPLVFVIDPTPVRFAHGEVTPHLNEDGTLCLYDPSGNEWSPDLSIADTTVPWASLWLLYYEDWLITGNWKGGGPPMPDHVVRRITQAHLEAES